jgi:hypothetical protein
VLRRRLLQAEAVICLVTAKVALEFVPWRFIEAYLARAPSGPQLAGMERERVREEVRRTVLGVSRRLPGMVCFQQALAAQAMLRRRSVATTLVCGAAATSGRLESHVWLADGEEIVTGEFAGASATALKRYP